LKQIREVQKRKIGLFGWNNGMAHSQGEKSASKGFYNLRESA
jgi:hypothetical protein